MQESFKKMANLLDTNLDMTVEDWMDLYLNQTMGVQLFDQLNCQLIELACKWMRISQTRVLLK